MTEILYPNFSYKTSCPPQPNPPISINFQYCQSLFNQFDYVKRSIISDIIDNGGSLLEKNINKQCIKDLESLIKRDIIYRKQEGQDIILKIHLEYALGFQLSHHSRNSNIYLLSHLNKISSKSCEPLLRHYNIISKGDKLSQKIILYKTILERQKDKFASLTQFELILLAIVFYNQNDVEIEHLLSELRKDAVLKEMCYGLNEKFRDCFSDPSRGHLESGNELLKAFALLVNKGFIIPNNSNDYYSHYYKIKIPQEIFSTISAFFFDKAILEQAKIKAAFVVPAPLEYSSYENNILEDLIKFQLYRLIRPPEYTQKNEIKKSYFKTMNSFFNTDEKYLEPIFINIIEKRLSDNKNYDSEVDCRYCDYEMDCRNCSKYKTKNKSQVQSVNNISYDTFKFIKDELNLMNVSKEVLKTFVSLSNLNTWISIQSFFEYAVREKSLYKYWGILETDIDSIISFWLVLGLVRINMQKKCIQISPLGCEVLSEVSSRSTPSVVLVKDKPIVVQSNLEIMLPNNVETSVLIKLSEFLELYKIEKYVIFKMTRESLIRGLDNNWTLDKILEYFIKHSSNEIPVVVKDYIAGIISKRENIFIAPCNTVILCNDAASRNKIMSIKGLVCSTVAGHDNVIFVYNKNHEELKKLLSKNTVYASINKTSLTTFTENYNFRRYYNLQRFH